MNPLLDERQRSRLAQLANAVLPGAVDQPAASDIGIEQDPIDRALKSRPDLAADFATVLDRFEGDAENFLRKLTDTEFNLVMTLICAAYLMDAGVKDALDYPGQQALTPNRGGFGAEELVIEMMQQPKRYRVL
jgi:hypothetical protein